MELSAITEDVLSDDYEEGEILDEDSLYEDVSSLEFTDSDSETKKSLNKTVPKKLKKKKEHICKDESICRRDRTGKHCYARLRNRRSSLDSTEKNKNNIFDNKLDEVKTIMKKQKNRIASKPTGKRFDKKDNFHTSQKSQDRYKDFRSNRQSKNHDYQKNGYRKYRPPSPKHHPVANYTKTSLLTRLKAVGSIPVTKDDNLSQDENKILSDIDKLTDVDKKAETPEELDEWNLRIVALKTALLKKFSDKKKNGITIKRNSDSVDDSIVEYALEEYIKDHFPEQTPKDVDYRQLTSTDMEICDTQPLLIDQTLNSCFINEKHPVQFAETDIDCRAYTCYPFQNNVPNCEPISPSLLSPVINEEAVVPGSSLPIQEIPLPCLKEINTNNRILSNKKKRKRKRKPIVKNKLNIVDLENETAEEKELREIALSSVKGKKVSEGSLVEVNPENDLLKTLHVDTTSNNIESKPMSNNSSDPWDDVDEDILRAQLLSSISNKIPQTESSPQEVLQIKKPILKKINKENFQNLPKDKPPNERIYYNKHFLKKNSYQQIAMPCIQKMIINVNDSDTTEDEEEKPVKRMSTDIAASIDQLLQEVRTQTEIEQGNAMIDLKKSNLQAKVKDIKLISPNDVDKNKETLKNQELSKKPAKTPQDIKHLPAWQQEEYLRLKKKLLEKQLLWNKSVKSKIEEQKSPELDINKKPVKKPLPSPQPEEKSNIDDITQPKKICVKESWQYSKDFNDMTTVVNKLEKDIQEFKALKRDSARIKRELALLQNRMIKKKRIMISVKEVLEKKEKFIKSKMISEFPLKKNEAEDPEKLKGKELVYFKFKEISLKAQLACINLNKELKTVRSAKTPKKEPTSPPKKRMRTSTDLRSTASKLKAKTNPPVEKNQTAVHSVSESGSLDPFTPLCPYDMAGVCNDAKCQFQHLRPT